MKMIKKKLDAFSPSTISKVKSGGLTLLELLVVVAILGLLAAVGSIFLRDARIKARETQRVGHLTDLRTALEIYYVDKGVYPNTGGVWVGHCDIGNWISGLVPDYMSKLPEDPVGCNCPGAIRGGGYVYRSDRRDYKILIDGCMESKLHTSPGKPFDDPIRGWQWGAIYSPGARNW